MILPLMDSAWSDFLNVGNYKRENNLNGDVMWSACDVTWRWMFAKMKKRRHIETPMFADTSNLWLTVFF